MAPYSNTIVMRISRYLLAYNVWRDQDQCTASCDRYDTWNALLSGAESESSHHQTLGCSTCNVTWSKTLTTKRIVSPDELTFGISTSTTIVTSCSELYVLFLAKYDENKWAPLSQEDSVTLIHSLITSTNVMPSFLQPVLSCTTRVVANFPKYL